MTLDVILKQLPIDDASRANLAAIRINVFNDTVNTYAEKVFTGSMSLGQWEESMKAEIKALHTSVATISKGSWESMNSSDWGRVGAAVKAQYRYLHGFAENISENRETLSLRAIQARARMYGNAAKNTGAVIQAGEFAGGTRRKPGRIKALPWMPGDLSTVCGHNCRCHWSMEVISISKKSKLVQARWTLTPAEHCEDCIHRENYTTILNVPLDTVVPPTIGGL